MNSPNRPGFNPIQGPLSPGVQERLIELLGVEAEKNGGKLSAEKFAALLDDLCDALDLEQDEVVQFLKKQGSWDRLVEHEEMVEVQDTELERKYQAVVKRKSELEREVQVLNGKVAGLQEIIEELEQELKTKK